MEISYVNSLDNISPEMLEGFFAGWENKPTKETHFEILRGSSHVVLAVAGKKVIGFINAISDKTFSAYIPLLEVLPEYQSKGIGTELVKRMLEQLKDFYMIDLLCDTNLQTFYEQLGMSKSEGMSIRNYSAQSGIHNS